MFRFRLRTLLIVLAFLPLLGAGGYWTWDYFRPKPWYYVSDGWAYFLPPNKPGLRWAQTYKYGLIEVSDDREAD